MIQLDSWEKQDDEGKLFAPRLLKLCEKKGIPCHVAPLPVGDISFISAQLDRVLIERKDTSSDLFTSLAKRLPDQISRLTQNADEAILLLDGPLTIGANGSVKGGRYKSNWKFTALQNFILSCQRAGVHVLQCHNQRYTPEAVLKLYEYYQKTELEHTSLVASRLKPFPTRPKGLSTQEKKLRVIMAITGIGPQLAKQLLDAFGSVALIAQAQEDELLVVDGVGKETAKQIKDALS